MDNIISRTIEEINELTRQNNSIEFRIASCSSTSLVIQGAPFLYFGPKIEIEFHLPFFHILFHDWKIDPDISLIAELRDETARSLNEQYRISQGNCLFRIANEDNTFCFIACERLSYRSYKNGS